MGFQKNIPPQKCLQTPTTSLLGPASRKVWSAMRGMQPHTSTGTRSKWWVTCLSLELVPLSEKPKGNSGHFRIPHPIRQILVVTIGPLLSIPQAKKWPRPQKPWDASKWLPENEPLQCRAQGCGLVALWGSFSGSFSQPFLIPRLFQFGSDQMESIMALNSNYSGLRKQLENGQSERFATDARA